MVPRGEAEPQPDSVGMVMTGWWLVPAPHPAQHSAPGAAELAWKRPSVRVVLTEIFMSSEEGEASHWLVSAFSLQFVSEKTGGLQALIR